MVVTKSEAGRAASAYFRPARRLPALVTVLALGYLAVRRAAGRRVSFGPPGPRRPRGRVLRLRGRRLPRLPARAGGRWAPGAGVRSGRLASAAPSRRGPRAPAESEQSSPGRKAVCRASEAGCWGPAVGGCSENGWVVFWPQSVPYQSLGPLGLFTQYLVDHHHTLLHSGYWLTWLIHVGESLYAMVLCKSKGITNGRAQLLWFLQTFLFGIASLSILIAYRPKRQKQT
nr:transmembrane protein 254 isoform X1 [Vulpes vulpes]